MEYSQAEMVVCYCQQIGEWCDTVMAIDHTHSHSKQEMMNMHAGTTIPSESLDVVQWVKGRVVRSLVIQSAC